MLLHLVARYIVGRIIWFGRNHRIRAEAIDGVAIEGDARRRGSILALRNIGRAGDREPFGRIKVQFSADHPRSEEHTSELQSLMRISYAVFCLKKKKLNKITKNISKSNKNQQTNKPD